MTATAEITETQRFRSQVGHISRQSGMFFAGTVFSVALGYVFKVYLARALGANALGIYALGMTLVSSLGIFNSLGLPHSAVRFVAAYMATGKFAELRALIWRGSVAVLAAHFAFVLVFVAFGPWVATHFYHSAVLAHYLPWFALIMLSGALNFFYEKVLAGYREIGRKTLITSFIGNPATMLLTVVLVTLGLGLTGYLAAQVIGALLVCGLFLRTVRRLTPVSARFSANRGARLERKVWSFSATMLGVGFMEFLISQVDKIALGFYRGTREVGIYSVAAVIVAYVPLALGSINSIFSPTISDLHTRGEYALLARLFQSLTKWALGLTLPLAAIIIVFAQPLMRIFGPEFEIGWPILIIGTIGQLVNCGVGSVSYLLIMSGHEKLLIRVQASMAALMVLLSAALVPICGIVGAATAAAVTTIATNILNLIQVRKALGFLPYNRSYAYLVLPEAAVVALALLFRRNAPIFHHDWLVVGVCGFLAYALFGSLVFAFGLNEDDRLIANAIWSRIRAFAGLEPSEAMQ